MAEATRSTVRRTVVAAACIALLATGLVLVPAGPVPPPAAAETPVPTTGGRMSVQDWQARQDDYLAWAASRPLSPGDPMSIMAHAEHARRTGGTWDSDAPTVAAFQGTWDLLDQFGDTGDFRINALLDLMLRYGDQLSPELQAEIEEHILSFKYWWTEPTPPGIVDSQYYWTENHLIIFLADELIAGQTYPDEVFTNSGMTGREHMDHARPLILRWMALRARFGFSEWLSNVYWMEDFMALMLLAEHSDDAEIAWYATQMLDALFVELGSHLHEGAFGATHGRSYNKDKMTALDEDTFTMARMVFDDTAYPYQRVDRGTMLGVAQRYRPPAVALAIADDDRVTVTRQRQSLPLDPLEPVTSSAAAPYGLSYDDPFVWWSMGAQLSWQVVPLSVNLLETYDLWQTDNFQQVAALQPIVQGSTLPDLLALASALAPAINPGLLSEVDTYTWRSPEVMLSTAQDHRPGQRGEQNHTWQATLDANAQVFTTHPSAPVPSTTNWYQDTGYWTGDGTMPRSVQHERVNVSVYAPQFASEPLSPVPFLKYEPYTHAYFPTDHFDEVIRQDGWVIGRKGDGFVALWSWRPADWRVFDPATEPTNGMTGPFDLVAPGGPDNVWVTEVGRAAEWPGPDPFQSFVQAVTAAPVEVTPLDDGRPCLPGDQTCTHGYDDGFDVSYASPTAGEVVFGQERPLSVAGAPIDIDEYPRWSSAWSEVPWGDLCYPVTAGGQTLVLDFSALEPLITDETAALGELQCQPTTPPPTGGEGGAGPADPARGTSSPTDVPGAPPTPAALPAPRPAAPRFTG